MDPLIIIWAGGGLAFVLLVVGIIITISSERSLVEQRLGQYVENTNAANRKKEKESPLTDWLNTRVEKSSWGDKIGKELARADLKMKPGEYIAVLIIVATFMAFFLWFIGGRIPIIAILGFLIGLALPRFYVKKQQSKRLIKFNDQLSDMLNLMVNGLRAGYSTTQAMEAVSRELPPPISDEFRRVVQEMQLGVPMERALENLLRRIPSDDLDLIITAINVQREVGGNLAEILETISHTIRERVRIKGEIRVLTTQASYSGKFLAMLPVILMGILYLLNREYMMEFFIEKNNSPLPCGYIGLAVAAGMIISGYFVMSKMAEVEV